MTEKVPTVSAADMLRLIADHLPDGWGAAHVYLNASNADEFATALKALAELGPVQRRDSYPCTYGRVDCEHGDVTVSCLLLDLGGETPPPPPPPSSAWPVSLDELNAQWTEGAA